jgi:hypothetical protein
LYGLFWAVLCRKRRFVFLFILCACNNHSYSQDEKIITNPSSLEYFQLNQSSDPKIYLNLSSASLVEIYQDNILRDIRFYDSGNQLLNTDELQEGSYYIDIIIEDIRGNIQNQREFYSSFSEAVTDPSLFEQNSDSAQVVIVPAAIMLESKGIVNPSEPLIDSSGNDSVISTDLVTNTSSLTKNIADSELVIDSTLPRLENISSEALPQVLAAASEPGNVTDSAELTAESSVAPSIITTPTQNPAARSRVPPGFEQLLEEQTTVIDIFYGGVYLTSSLATFDNQTVTLLQPENVSTRIPDLIKPELLKEFLSQPLPGNESEVCYSQFQIDCGYLETDSVSYIFNRSTLQLWVFVAGEYLSTRPAMLSKYLPASTAGLTFINNSDVSFSLQNATFRNLNILNDTYISYKENIFSLKSVFSKNNNIEFENISLKRDFRGKEISAGLFRPENSGSRFQNSSRMLGISLMSSMLTRTDLDSSLGTQIQLFLPTRSLVEIYRDNILLTSSSYETGNQLINTEALPNGAYNIDLVIVDAAGNTTTQTQFYSKSSQIPPDDEFVYYMQAGEYYDQQDQLLIDDNKNLVAKDNRFIRGGISTRIKDNLSANLGFIHEKYNSLLELGLFRQGYNDQFQLNASFEDSGASALDFRYNYSSVLFGLNVSYLKVFNNQAISLLGNQKEQYNATLNMNTSYGTFSVFSRSSESVDQQAKLNYGIRYRNSTFNIADTDINTQFELSENDGDLVALFNFTIALDGKYGSTSISPRINYSDNKLTYSDLLAGNISSRWNFDKNAQHSTDYTLRANYAKNSSVEGRVNAQRKWGNANLTTRYVTNNKLLDITGRVKTSFASTLLSSTIGNPNNQNSGFMVKIQGDESIDASYDIYVNGQSRATINSGESTLIPLSPYETYSISAQGVGNELVSVSKEIYTHTLYPGNFIDLQWRAKKIIVVLGMITDSQGSPLQNALLSNAEGLALTDSNGFFQAEIDANEEELLVRKNSTECTVSFPETLNDEQVFYLGTLQCL